MGKFTAAQIKDHGDKILERFDDGFQWSDLIEIVPQAMEVVGAVQAMTGEEKHESAKAILDYVIDETDIPWLPDSLVDPILKMGVDKLMPILFKASQGQFSFKAAEEEPSE